MEFKEDLTIHHAKLYREDLFLLEDFLKYFFSEYETFEIEINTKSYSDKFLSIKEMIEKNIEITRKTNIHISMFHFGKRPIHTLKSISIDFNNSRISFGISDTDEIWVKGTKLKINEYFKKYKPWYSFIQFDYFTHVMSVIWGISVFFNLYKTVYSLIFGVPLFIFGVTGVILNLISPRIKISLDNRENKKNVSGKVGTIIGFLIGIISCIFGVLSYFK
ncbi:hypothetical protein [Sporolactobacillus laevolacticus]|uniref:hypothetical protein n=1 Tax=Sporolactobacillus laevolacticus TaxID=33018 RepID=UPI0025B51C9A|nr:hypothetical protein [Sporolactobacillus laevolacticus]MDN3956198.1 hypothetical protein [Sporolactobacillus laevolacticus]